MSEQLPKPIAPKANDDDNPSNKEVAYYATCLQAWVATRMEYDKTLITLSSAGIGLLISLYSTVGTSHWMNAALFFLACGLFLGTVTVCLLIFRLNANHLEAAAGGSDLDDGNLNRLDLITTWLFLLGVATAIGSVFPFAIIDRIADAAK